jgi:hypothetical protein
VSWTLASLLTPLVFLASFVRPNHSATSRPGIIVSPQRLRHITAAGDASKERAPSLANADSVVNGGGFALGGYASDGPTQLFRLPFGSLTLFG